MPASAEIKVGSPYRSGLDWSASNSALTNFHNRFASAYLDKRWRSDISFYVEDEQLRIPAHKLIVAAASPVLERCCFGSGDCVLPSTEIPVANCTSASVWVLLRHLYGCVSDDHRSQPSLLCYNRMAANIGMKICNAAEVFRLADYYDLRQLQDICKPFLMAQLNVENVCAIYNQVRLLEDQLVARRCVQKMVFNAIQVLNDAMQMDGPAIVEFLRADDLRLCDETELFDALCKWAKEQCVGESSAARLREVLQDILPHVRFGCMTLANFEYCLTRVESAFFSAQEIETITQQISKPNGMMVACPFAAERVTSPVVPYWCKPRTEIVCYRRTVSIAEFQSEHNWDDTPFMEMSLQLSAACLDYEYALTGLTIPQFEGVVHVMHSTQSGEWTIIQTRVENDVVLFEPEIRQNNENNWAVKVRLFNPLGRACYRILPINRNVTSPMYREYLMMSEVHIMKWKRS